MAPSLIALAGFAAWQLLLTIALAVFRTALVNTGRKAPNAFAPDGSDLPGFGQRLTRARDNCYENLPVFAALIAAAGFAGRFDVTDGLALWVLAARIGQTLTHLASTEVPGIMIRFGFYLAQIGILSYWAILLLS